MRYCVFSLANKKKIQLVFVHVEEHHISNNIDGPGRQIMAVKDKVVREGITKDTVLFLASVTKKQKAKRT